MLGMRKTRQYLIYYNYNIAWQSVMSQLEQSLVSESPTFPNDSSKTKYVINIYVK